METYFYNAGVLMALLYAFGGNDFHMENIISAGTRPVMIDTETLMIPVARPFEDGGRDRPEESGSRKGTLEEMVEDSVLNIGMLPLVRADENLNKEDLGALTGASADWSNLPVCDGVKYSAVQYPGQVGEGFRWMYRRILENKQELLEGRYGIRLFLGCRFRLLIRTSQVYANVIKYISRSALLKDGFDYSLQTERMAKAFLYTARRDPSGSDPGVPIGKKALESGCIPIFYGEPDGEGIWMMRSALFELFQHKSGGARDRMHRTDE